MGIRSSSKYECPYCRTQYTLHPDQGRGKTPPYSGTMICSTCHKDFDFEVTVRPLISLLPRQRVSTFGRAVQRPEALVVEENAGD